MSISKHVGPLPNVKGFVCGRRHGLVRERITARWFFSKQDWQGQVVGYTAVEDLTENELFGLCNSVYYDYLDNQDLFDRRNQFGKPDADYIPGAFGDREYPYKARRFNDYCQEHFVVEGGVGRVKKPYDRDLLLSYATSLQNLVTKAKFKRGKRR